MGVDVVLETERGDRIDVVADPGGVIARVAGVAHGDAGFRLLGYIDPYGDAVFNALQLDDLLNDLERVSAEAWTADERVVMERVKALVWRCKDAQPHVYIRFIGD